MALETLKGVEKIGGFGVGHMTTKNIGTIFSQHVIVDHTENEIIFTIQNGPIKENGRATNTGMRDCERAAEQIVSAKRFALGYIKLASGAGAPCTFSANPFSDSGCAPQTNPELR